MHDLLPLADELASTGMQCVFPQAPYQMPGYPGGYAWFPRSPEALSAFATGAAFSDLSSFDPPGLAASARELAQVLDQLGALPEQTVVCGFSQGAMVATELVLGGHWERPAGLVILSGSLIARDRWYTQAPSRAEGLAVLQSHGTLDPVLPEHQARALAKLLSGAGADHEYVSFVGGHAIPDLVLSALKQFLLRVR